jgi:hypothetical protein
MMNLDDVNGLMLDDDLLSFNGEDIDLIYAFMMGSESSGSEESSIMQEVPPPDPVGSMELDALAIILALDA